MKLPASFYNWTSLVGAIIAVITLFMIIFLLAVSLFLGEGSSYLGLVIYILLPVFLVIGLILIPIGMVIRMKKEKKQKPDKGERWPKIDFNYYRHRNAFIVFAVGSTIFLLLSAIGSYEAFHYTESVEFCGTVCHTVMEPEHVAYQNSPHARVPCVDCHVGTGASWYVRSKLSGLYQVYAVMADVYPRPIPSPISNLRPAQETCERCHWPEQFYSHNLKINKHYLADEMNTEWDITRQMKIGSVYSAKGLDEGIHWHINPDVRIEYMVNPETHRDTIPWVRYTNLKTNEVIEYTDPEFYADKSSLEGMEVRTMDCIDCHNRPSHAYVNPVRFVNEAMTAGDIPRDLPDIKIVAMDVLNQEFPTKDSAFSFIDSEVRLYYEYMHEDVFENEMEKIDKAVEALQRSYSKNIFPYMKVKWDVYPNHLGHLEFDGCHRCHNDRHVSEKGRVISRDCNLCHTIVAQGNPDTITTSNLFMPLEFVHPNDPNQAWKDEFCSECHRTLY
jgi:hypothetical protein